MEGKRVHGEIKEAYREAHEAAGNDGSLNGALGKTIPRESDKQLLRDFEERRQNAASD